MDFSRDAGLFPFQIDPAGDRVLLVRMGEEDYRGASFLDQRLLQQKQRPMQWFDYAQLEQATLPPADARFIFHIGHVGSTLIARLLGEAQGVLALREPLILRQFAELRQLRERPESPWDPTLYEPRLGKALQWLSRGFPGAETALVKATSFANEIAGDVLERGHKTLFLQLAPERYFQTILAGENSRQELAALTPSRLTRLHARLGEEPFKLWTMSEGERVALGWACEMVALEEADDGSAMRLDFDAFLAEPAPHLMRVASHLDIGLRDERAAELIASPIMSQYSKAPEHGYTPQLREEVLGEAARNHRQAIGDGMRWLDEAGKHFPLIAAALERGAE